jgi:hypothetical protein
MAHAFALTYTYQDDSSHTATHDIHVPTAFSLSQLTEFGRSLADLLDNVVSGLIISLDLTITANIAGLTVNTAQPLGDVEEVGNFQFVTADGRSVEVNLPGIDESVVLAGSDDIFQAAGSIAPFIAAMENGIVVTGGTISPCDVNEDDIIDTVYAREAFRSSGKRR